ncbi:hypothetical protein V2G26_012724 [Clonostachys chloroleuca]
MDSQAVPPANILLYGAGSICGVYLYQLLQAGCNVTAVCRSNYEVVKADGFKLTSIRYGNVLYKAVSIIKSVSDYSETSIDFILVCTKSFPGIKPSLADQLSPVLQGRPYVAVVLAQNGVLIEEELAVAFPDNPILSGVVYCPAVQTGPGEVEYPEMMNLLELGTFPSTAPKSHKDAVHWFAGLMEQGGGRAQAHEDIQIPRWPKLLMNAAWNPTGALTLTTDGDFLTTSEHARDLAWGIMMEIIEVAQKIGIPGITVEVAEKKYAIARKRARVVR